MHTVRRAPLSEAAIDDVIDDRRRNHHGGARDELRCQLDRQRIGSYLDVKEGTTMEFRDISAAAFERLATRQVEREFAGLPDDPDAPLPWIGHFPHERAVQKQVVISALCAVRWFETRGSVVGTAAFAES